MKIKTESGEVNVTSQGQGTLNTVLGAIGTAGSLGVLSGLLGNGNRNQPQSEGDRPVTRYEMDLWQRINEEKTKNALLEAKGYTDKAMFDVQKQFGLQGAWNAAMGANVKMLQKQVDDITEFVVPINSIDPVPTSNSVTGTQSQNQNGNANGQ